jgi:hypothetical protein
LTSMERSFTKILFTPWCFKMLPRLQSFVGTELMQHVGKIGQKLWQMLLMRFHFWGSSVGAYLDHRDSSAPHPQDGNSHAVIAKIANSNRSLSALKYRNSHNK